MNNLHGYSLVILVALVQLRGTNLAISSLNYDSSGSICDEISSELINYLKIGKDAQMVGQKNLCPLEGLYPCNCSTRASDSSINIYCPPQVNDVRELKQILTTAEFQTDQVALFVLITSNISGLLPYDLFYPLRIRNLLLLNDRFNTTDNDAFLNSHETLRYLDMSENNLKWFYFDEINRMSALSCLNLDGNLLPAILSNMFTSDTLTRLSLSDNNIKSIGSFAFSNLTQLFILRLSDNNLTTLSENSFHFFHHRKDRYTEIYLQNNQINNISTIAFSGLSSFIIDFRNNSIPILWSDVFQPLILEANYRVTFIMEGNPIICDTSLMWAVNNVMTDCFDDFTCTNINCSFLDLYYDADKDSVHCRP